VIAIVACSALFLNAADDAIDEAADAFDEVPESDYNVEIEDCDADEFGSVTVGGTLENKTGTRQAFEVQIEVKEDGTVVETPSAFTDSVSDGDTIEWETFSTANEDADVECELVRVNKTIFDDEEGDLFGD
jgi:hypothetical protein